MKGVYKGIPWKSLMSEAQVQKEIAEVQPKTPEQKRMALYLKKAKYQGNNRS